MDVPGLSRGRPWDKVLLSFVESFSVTERRQPLSANPIMRGVVDSTIVVKSTAGIAVSATVAVLATGLLNHDPLPDG